MRWVVIRMIGVVMASASTGLSPEWDRFFDEAFTDLITEDDELVRAELDDLIAAEWPAPSSPGSPPAASRGEQPTRGGPRRLPVGGSDPSRDQRPAGRPPP